MKGKKEGNGKVENEKDSRKKKSGKERIWGQRINKRSGGKSGNKKEWRKESEWNKISKV